ncbi:alpha/beta fold hydrolase [Streptomyces sp. NBC_00083]|uniref:alpha/beta fold hydrolase n=1 Tax=Streptomyces sp. NBC_00083 TaxID=2975647 RepID=UPI002252A104|nr:alpha/beta hydrolase [Streptomyces sp. NBC_00083]MCX5383995.1 alpha/beta fold hydrolase [Streptomyces sp. NBC_00083]
MPTFTSHDGTRLAYRVTGRGEPLICLPGGPGRAATYLGDLGGLAEHRRLVLLDPRGTGESAVPADPASYRCDRQVADVEALRAHLGLDRVDLLGHSAGGNLALLYAGRHPDRVGSLALITPGTRAVDIDAGEAEWRAAVALRAGEPWYEAGRAAFEEVWAGRPVSEAGDAVKPFAYGRWDAAARRHDAAAGSETNPDVAPAYYAEGAFDPPVTRAALARLDAPVLVLAAEYDPGPTPGRAAELAALMPRAELAVQWGAGHYPWLDDAEGFVRTVAAFLDPAVATVRHTVGAGDGRGVRLAYRVRGERSAPPVILVHGRGGDSRDWDEIAGHLAATRRVYALDLRGHGLSDWPGRYSFEAFRDDLIGFITGLGLTGADVVGHSMGGAAAALLAQEAPGLIGRLVLEDVPPLLPLDPPRGPVERPKGPLGFDWPVIADINAQLNTPDPAWHRRFATLTTATLVLAGGPRSHVDQKALAALAGRIPRVRLATFTTGHLIHETDPAGFLAALREFGIG